MLYYKFSDYLKNKYGTKVYKLPVNIPVTCPNRDGLLSSKGCIFCGDEGAGFETLSNSLSVKEQLEKNSKYIGKNYNTEKFIAYFQNYSNAYLPFEQFEKYINEACVKGVVAIYISTRPDCIEDRYLRFLKDLKENTGIDIVVEIGLQTVNYHTLRFLNRGHSLAEFIDAAARLYKFGLECCVHYIIDLPMDSIEDVVEGAKILSALGIKQVKCHSLYVLKDTELGRMYENGEIIPLSAEDFIERTIEFLEYLDPDIVYKDL